MKTLLKTNIFYPLASRINDRYKNYIIGKIITYFYNLRNSVGIFISETQGRFLSISQANFDPYLICLFNNLTSFSFHKYFQVCNFSNTFVIWPKFWKVVRFGLLTIFWTFLFFCVTLRTYLDKTYHRKYHREKAVNTSSKLCWILSNILFNTLIFSKI